MNRSLRRFLNSFFNFVHLLMRAVYSLEHVPNGTQIALGQRASWRDARWRNRWTRWCWRRWPQWQTAGGQRCAGTREIGGKLFEKIYFNWNLFLSLLGLRLRVSDPCGREVSRPDFPVRDSLGEVNFNWRSARFLAFVVSKLSWLVVCNDHLTKVVRILGLVLCGAGATGDEWTLKRG